MAEACLLERLVSGPGLYERAVHAEVFAKEQVLLFGLGQYFVEQGDDGVVLNEPFAVLGEDGGYPDAVVHGQANEPAVQEVVLGLFHQLPF